MCFGESTLEAIDYTREAVATWAKQKMNGHATGRDRRHGMRAEQLRSQWLRGLIPDQNMFTKDGTRNLKHGGCGGSEFRCGLIAASDRKETSN